MLSFRGLVSAQLLFTLCVLSFCGDEPSYKPDRPSSENDLNINPRSSPAASPQSSPSPNEAPIPTSTPTPTPIPSPSPSTPTEPEKTCKEVFMQHFADPIREGIMPCATCHDFWSVDDDDFNFETFRDFYGNNPKKAHEWFREDTDHMGGSNEKLCDMDKLTEFDLACE